jgi:CcmD family protein
VGTFLIAYLVVSIALMLYVLRLGASRRRLERRLKALQSQSDVVGNQEEPTSKAA